jgi:hypothetical protein
MRQTDGQHACSPNRTQYRAHFSDFGLLLQSTKIETGGGALEQLRSRREPGCKLILDCVGVRRADTNLCQTNLTETNLECGLV